MRLSILRSNIFFNTYHNKLFLLLLASALFSLYSVNTLNAQTPDHPIPTSIESDPLEGTYSERQAQGIDRMIMCPVCPAETIDQAQVEISFQMRKIVRQMLSEGSSRDEILDFFVDRYGKDILAAPPKSGVTLVAWLLPMVGVIGGLVAVYFILRSMTRRGPEIVTTQPKADVGLIPYLQLIDQHLEMRRAAPRSIGTSGHTGSAVESSRTTTADETEESR